MTTDGYGPRRRWNPPRANVVLSGGPVDARQEESDEPVERRYVGFRNSNETEPLLWMGDDN